MLKWRFKRNKNSQLTGLVCPLIWTAFALIFCGNPTQAQVPIDLDEFNKKSDTQVTIEGNMLNISWLTGDQNRGYMTLNLQQGTPLIQSIELDSADSTEEVAADLNPAFLLTVGDRNLDRNGWTVFFDSPVYGDFQTYSVRLEKKEAQIVSEGNRTHIVLGTATGGPFSGTINLTLYNGSPLMNVSAEMSTEIDSLAIIYDAGFTSPNSPWEEIYWSDTDDIIQNTTVDGSEKSKEVKVKYRTIIGENEHGSMAVFPPPHQYFYPLDNAYNENYTWYGRNYRDEVDDFGIGIRHDLLGDRRYVPWFNAPPNTQQDLNFFSLLSTQKDGKLLQSVKKYTHSDKYKPLEGYYTMSSHFHEEHTQNVLTHEPLPEVPGFVKTYREMGINIIHMGEFHLWGSPKGPEIKRFTELQKFFEECARLSNGNFLLLPGEEPNNWFGGHWMNIFAEPVYWVMDRDEDQPFVEEHPDYGKIYRIGSKEDMMKLLELKDGLAWTAHPRIKGSIGYPDKYKDEEFYKSDRFLGAAWKSLPADLSNPELGKRVLDLMDDMANWGLKKHVIAEADLFNMEPDYEMYGPMNVNYLQLDELPKFEDGWPSIIDAMQQGKFFSTTGEILLPEFRVNNKGAGETLNLNGDGDVTIDLKVSWTFPLKYVEIISGDGEQVYKEKKQLRDAKSFGERKFEFSTNLEGRNWVRVEVWDVATNGAFTQIVWLE